MVDDLLAENIVFLFWNCVLSNPRGRSGSRFSHWVANPFRSIRRGAARKVGMNVMPMAARAGHIAQIMPGAKQGY
jgi:hypothetical protein